jgi:hypothetical protein
MLPRKYGCRTPQTDALMLCAIPVVDPVFVWSNGFSDSFLALLCQMSRTEPYRTDS